MLRSVDGGDGVIIIIKHWLMWYEFYFFIINYRIGSFIFIFIYISICNVNYILFVLLFKT